MADLFACQYIYEAKSVKYAKRKIAQSPAIQSSAAAYDFIRNLDAFGPVEKLGVLILNNSHHVDGFFYAGEGTNDRAALYPKEIAKRLILMSASACIIWHNHPGGSLVASQPDIEFTRNLHAGLKLLDVDLLDSLVVTENGYFSLQENGLLIGR